MRTLLARLLTTALIAGAVAVFPAATHSCPAGFQRTNLHVLTYRDGGYEQYLTWSDKQDETLEALRDPYLTVRDERRLTKRLRTINQQIDRLLMVNTSNPPSAELKGVCVRA